MTRRDYGSVRRLPSGRWQARYAQPVPADRRDLRRRLFHLAAEQGGYFTAPQAMAEGYSYQAQAHHVAAGN